jgi:hypothetical protein
MGAIENLPPKFNTDFFTKFSTHFGAFSDLVISGLGDANGVCPGFTV